MPLEIAGTELVYETVVAIRAAELGEARPHAPKPKTTTTKDASATSHRRAAPAGRFSLVPGPSLPLLCRWSRLSVPWSMVPPGGIKPTIFEKWYRPGGCGKVSVFEAPNGSAWDRYRRGETFSKPFWRHAGRGLSRDLVHRWERPCGCWW